MRLKFFIPLLAFVVLAISLGVGLTLKPREIPSALIGEPVPEFSLPGIPGHEDGLSTADFGNGEVVLVNVFASWCIPCRQEHPLFMELARTGRIGERGDWARSATELSVRDGAVEGSIRSILPSRLLVMSWALPPAEWPGPWSLKLPPSPTAA